MPVLTAFGMMPPHFQGDVVLLRKFSQELLSQTHQVCTVLIQVLSGLVRQKLIITLPCLRGLLEPTFQCYQREYFACGLKGMSFFTFMVLPSRLGALYCLLHF